jgi:hypothetical protein
VVDDEKVKQLAALRGTSESEAVRDAIDFVLAGEEIASAIRELHDLAASAMCFTKCPRSKIGMPRPQVLDTTEIIRQIRDTERTVALARDFGHGSIAG